VDEDLDLSLKRQDGVRVVSAGVCPQRLGEFFELLEDVSLAQVHRSQMIQLA